MLEVVEAVAGAVGAERVGLRLSPYNTFLSAQDSVPRAIEKNVWLMKELDRRVPGLAYIHMVGWGKGLAGAGRHCGLQPGFCHTLSGCVLSQVLWCRLSVAHCHAAAALGPVLRNKKSTAPSCCHCYTSHDS